MTTPLQPDELTLLRSAYDAVSRSIAHFDAAVAARSGLPANHLPFLTAADLNVVDGYMRAGLSALNQVVALRAERQADSGA